MGTTSERLGVWLTPSEHTARRGALSSAAVIAVLLALAWWLTLAAGGSHTVLPHLFYVPIIIAALRFTAAGAGIVAVAAGILAGPLMPLDTSTGQAQDTWGWLLRGVLFVGLGQLAAWLPRHEPHSSRALVQDTRMAMRLRMALHRGDIDLHYQPIVDLRHGTIVAVEALARWTHPVNGPIPPGAFIPVAERAGMIATVDRYVMALATRQAQEWTGKGLVVTVSVNVSATRFSQPGLIDDVDEALARSGLDPHQLQLEITETALLRDMHASAAQIRALRRRGIRIAVDDFGAGQTSLGHFHQFTADTVKLDRTFVAKAATDPQTARLLRGLIRLFESLGADVVGEGISDESEYLTTLRLGCPLGQGFFLARPAPAAEVEGLLAERAHVAWG